MTEQPAAGGVLAAASLRGLLDMYDNRLTRNQALVLYLVGWPFALLGVVSFVSFDNGLPASIVSGVSGIATMVASIYVLRQDANWIASEHEKWLARVVESAELVGQHGRLTQSAYLKQRWANLLDEAIETLEDDGQPVVAEQVAGARSFIVQVAEDNEHSRWSPS